MDTPVIVLRVPIHLQISSMIGFDIEKVTNLGQDVAKTTKHIHSLVWYLSTDKIFSYVKLDRFSVHVSRMA
jgi:hypothetical protein